MTQMRDRIANIAEQIVTQMDLLVLENGWELFRRFAIVSLQPEEHSFLKADVRDKQAFEVCLHMDQVAQSTCSCGSGPLCRHVAAAFFQAYNLYGHSTAAFLSACKQYHQAQKLEKMTSTNEQPTHPASLVQPVHPKRRRNESIGLPTPEQSPEQWLDFLAANFDFTEDIIHTSAHHTALSYYEYANSEEWDSTLRMLYQLHVLLFLLLAMERKLQTASQDWSYVRIQWKLDEQFMALLEEIDQLLEHSSPELAFMRYPQIITSLRQLLLEGEIQLEQSSLDWNSVYLLFWEHLFNLSDWRVKEKKRLELELNDSTSGSKKWKYLQRAVAWHEVLDGHDREAMERLHPFMKQDKLLYYWSILFFHVNKGNWSKVLSWITFMMPAMERATRNEWSLLMKAWSQGIEQDPDEPEWHRVMALHLHFTYWYYSEHLIKKGMYRTWVDVHLYHKLSPGDISKELLRQVEQHDKSLLLPLYHQATERAISIRNRDGYREAVRYMKKLKQYYKGLKRSYAWDRYIEYIVSQHSRLRALQEEIQKGKLLS